MFVLVARTCAQAHLANVSATFLFRYRADSSLCRGSGSATETVSVGENASASGVLSAAYCGQVNGSGSGHEVLKLEISK